MTETNTGRSVGEALVALLKAYGVDTIFGIPGVHNNELYRGLLNSGIRHVLPRHEQGAGFMADGYARVSGRPGVCFTITGPGLTNIMTPLGQAYSDSVPMLVISSALDIKDLGQGRGRLHEIQDQLAAAATVTGLAATAYAPEDVPELVAKAFAGFRTSRPRPAYIEIPIDVLSAEAAGDWSAKTSDSVAFPDPAAVSRAAEILATARRPLFIIGGGAVGASGSLRALVERLQPVVMPTVAGKGVVPDSHPLNVGAVMARGHAKKFISQADVVLAVGTELAETDFWEEWIPINGRLIRIDIDPGKLSDRYGGEVAILADAARAVEALLAALPQTAATNGSGMADAAALKETLSSKEPAARSVMRRVLAEVRQALPEETVLVSDMTTLAYAGNECFPVDAPRRWLHPNGYGTLGYALPAAVGAKIAAGEVPVVAIAGDYGFQYTLNELAVAAELNQALTVVLWNSQGLQAIIDDMDRKGIGHIATNPLNPDFEKLAGAYGFGYGRAADFEEIGDAIRRALASGGPQIVEIDGPAFS